jgi:hypothetical protein
MDVLVTIMVVDAEGDEIANVSASAETPQEAFDLAMQELDLENDD